MSSKEKWKTKRAGNLLRSKVLYYLPTKRKLGVLPYVPEEVVTSKRAIRS
jgi:hypothetical protein